MHAARCELSGRTGHPPAAGTRRDTLLQGLLAGLASLKPAAAAHAEEGSAEAREGEVRHTDAEWQELLTPEQYAVLRQAATEPRFSSPLYEEHRAGTFACAGCGAPLFSSAAKYNSGTGWPSFYDALPGAVDFTDDYSIIFMARTEVRCHRCQGHLGHVFDDGPKPSGKRFCMNGAALKFELSEA
eukprot:scaffold16.g59.t1